ncbi:MAG: Gfo/Idh/MocA family protein [Armatimonadota bacterium]
MPKRVNRRRMLRDTALAGVGVWAMGRNAWAENGSPNEKLDVACIGIGHRGRANVNAVAGENIVALCDVDDERAGDAYEKFPKAKKYYDFRVMLDEMGSQIDAVVVSTPDHTHAVAAAMAIKMGKHCYCEKPLTNSVNESLALTRLAAKHKVVTQLGTQHHAKSHFRRAVEIIRSGAIGPVSRVHVWMAGSRGMPPIPTDTPPVPEHLKWDLWLGPARYRPYHPAYCPYHWRFWWDFGTGETGNNGCHMLDLPFWALELRYPTLIEAKGPPPHPETSPKSMRVRYHFPARGDLPPVTLYWTHGPVAAQVSQHEDPKRWATGMLFIGDRGMLLVDYSKWKLLPEKDFADYELPGPTIPDSIGHHNEWIAACKEDTQPTCHFGYSGALSETVLLGNVAYRVGHALEWDAANARVTNCPGAEPYINRPYRAGWAL